VILIRGLPIKHDGVVAHPVVEILDSYLIQDIGPDEEHKLASSNRPRLLNCVVHGTDSVYQGLDNLDEFLIVHFRSDVDTVDEDHRGSAVNCGNGGQKSLLKEKNARKYRATRKGLLRRPQIGGELRCTGSVSE